MLLLKEYFHIYQLEKFEKYFFLNRNSSKMILPNLFIKSQYFHSKNFIFYLTTKDITLQEKCIPIGLKIYQIKKDLK
jgi:hypothetical protein